MKKVIMFLMMTMLSLYGVNAQRILGWEDSQPSIHTCVDKTHKKCDGLCTCDGMNCYEYMNHGIEVDVTVYQAVASQTDDTPCIASSGYNVCENKLGNVVAVSRDFLNVYNWKQFDRILLVDLNGYSQIYTIVDTMNARFVKKIDILSTSKRIHGKARAYKIFNYNKA